MTKELSLALKDDVTFKSQNFELKRMLSVQDMPLRLDIMGKITLLKT